MCGRAPEELVICLAAYLDTKLQALRVARLRIMKPKRMQMPWRDTTYTSDSGIFTMRHMEAYTGQDCANWNTGLQRGNAMQLVNLRKGYMHNILLSTVNSHSHSIAVRVQEFERQRLVQMHQQSGHPSQ